MDTIKKINPHLYSSCIKGSRKSAGGVLMDLVYYFQNYINLIKKRKLELTHIVANLDGNSGSISEVLALIILVGGMLAWREIEVEA